jgi:hypothetical protein
MTPRRRRLLAAALVTPVVLLVFELSYVATGQPTISRGIQEWSAANYQIAIAIAGLACGIVGWLLAHWTQPPS